MHPNYNSFFNYYLVQGHFPALVQKVYLLRPSSFLQKTFVDMGFKFLKDDFKFKVCLRINKPNKLISVTDTILKLNFIKTCLFYWCNESCISYWTSNYWWPYLLNFFPFSKLMQKSNNNRCGVVVNGRQRLTITLQICTWHLMLWLYCQ